MRIMHSIRDAGKKLLRDRGLVLARPPFPEQQPLDLVQIMCDREICRRQVPECDFVVVQIGANDGVSDDPLHHHIVRRGWRALLVEPLPDPFKSLGVNYAGCANVTLENAAIAHEDGPLTLYTVEGDSRLASFSLAVLRQQRWRIPDLESRIRRVEVTGLSLTSLLAKHDMRQIDLMQIDTEGFDYEIIRMLLGSTPIRPVLLRFESKHLSRADQLACARDLTEAGYRWLTLHGDTTAYRESMAPIG